MCMSFKFRLPLRGTYTLFPYRSNDNKYDLVFLEALVYQSYHGLIHHVGSPPFIGVVSFECFWTAAEAVGNPTSPAFIPDNSLPSGNRMTFYEGLQNTLFLFVDEVRDVSRYCRALRIAMLQL